MEAKTIANDRLAEIRDILKKLLERFKTDTSIWDGLKDFASTFKDLFNSPDRQAKEPVKENTSKESTKDSTTKESTKSFSKESTKLFTGLKDLTKSIKSVFSSNGLKELFRSSKSVFSSVRSAGSSVANMLLPISDSQQYPQQSTSKPNQSGEGAKSKTKDDDKDGGSHLTQRTVSRLMNEATKSINRRMSGSVTEAPSSATAVRGAGVAAQGAEVGAAGAGAAEAGGAAAGAGAGGAGAAGGGVAALASNPVGWVILAIAVIAAVVAAMIALPFLIKKWGESLLESQRNLAESSGKMAQVFAKKDVADTMREQRIGNATAESAGGLSDALIKLEDRIEPFTIIVTDFLNNVMTAFVEFATFILDRIIEGINMIIVGINKLIPGPDVLKKIEVNTRKKDENTDLGNVIKEWSNAGKGYHSGPAHGGFGPPVRGVI
jgi:hypothetical protein